MVDLNHFQSLTVLFIFLMMFVFIICVLVITPIYIWQIKKRYRSLWERDLEFSSILPYGKTHVLLVFLIKNKFTKTNDKAFIKYSYIFKYMLTVSTVTTLMNFIPGLSYFD